MWKLTEKNTRVWKKCVQHLAVHNEALQLGAFHCPTAQHTRQNSRGNKKTKATTTTNHIAQRQRCYTKNKYYTNNEAKYELCGSSLQQAVNALDSIHAHLAEIRSTQAITNYKYNKIQAVWQKTFYEWKTTGRRWVFRI